MPVYRPLSTTTYAPQVKRKARVPPPSKPHNIGLPSTPHKAPAVIPPRPIPAGKATILGRKEPINNTDVINQHADATDWDQPFFNHFKGPFSVQVKRDGERAWTEKKGDQVIIANKYKSVYLPSNSIYSAKDFPAGTNIERMPDSLAEDIRKALGAHDGVMDTEFRTKDDVLYTFLSHRRKPTSTETMVTWFDLLELDSQDVRNEPLEERRRLLTGAVKPNPRVEVVEARIAKNEAEARQIAQDYTKQGYEGGVVKPLDHPYDTSQWMLKLKRKRTVDLVVLGVEKTKDWVSRKVPHSFLVGVYNKQAGGWQVVGEVGTGLPDNVRAAMGKQIPSIAISDSDAMKAYGNEYDSHILYTSPQFVLEVEFLRITPNGALREPRIKNLRDNKPPEDCTDDQLLPSKTQIV